MVEVEFNNKEELNKFISKLTIEDVILLESSSKLFSILGKKEKSLETKIKLGEIEIEIIKNPDNESDFLVLLSLGSNFSIFKKESKFLDIFAKVQVIYRVRSLDMNDTILSNTVKNFVSSSAYVHILAFLRSYLMEMVSKSGYPRYVLPLFKQLAEEEFEEIEKK